MSEDPFKSKETLAVRVEIAKPGDWKAYKELRLLAIAGKDAEMFGVTDKPEVLEAEKNKLDKAWEYDISSDDTFVLLSWQGSEAVGMIRAKEIETGVWYLTSGYTKENSRGKIFAPSAFKVILKEIKKRGGTKIKIGVKAHNKIMIGIATTLGFKKVNAELNAPGFYMELDLNNAR